MVLYRYGVTNASRPSCVSLLHSPPPQGTISFRAAAPLPQYPECPAVGRQHSASPERRQPQRRRRWLRHVPPPLRHPPHLPLLPPTAANLPDQRKAAGTPRR
ncbi:hypothetical protein BU14_0432s0010 [Porphyra umbilicalis]|uniref:Uncharacterized protein n=1 Tax=Porphyra umbilicalis TaxID=2786 RepID=A0A1X6NV60_PORUM|nr:hypothetical protein BU14_0432s0010 [Porphyra umbilicalis]|eukprot:OSX72472.1 hypothetical protein BU14_0432s0010 [Porphyra umbilicalis]